MLRSRTTRSASGQVLPAVGVMLAVLLAFAGLAIDVGRQVAERRYLQNAADAAALGGCGALADGALDDGAAQAAREVGALNLARSPSGGSPAIAPDAARTYEDGHPGDPAHLTSGIVVSGTSVRVAVTSEMQTLLARVLGVDTVPVGARARCQLTGGPGLPIVARRYANAPGPGNGFVDHLATAATSTLGRTDEGSVLGYDNGSRTPASLLEPGPVFSLYGPHSKASNEAEFRGFVALDVRNFASLTSRAYFNGITPGTTTATLKEREAAYIRSGYPGPRFPAVTMPPDPNDQVAIFTGNDTAMVVGNFDDVHVQGDLILVAVYNGTVMKIPDFSISPPRSIDLAASVNGANGPNISVSRNREFNSTVTLSMRGDSGAGLASPAHPEYDLIGEPPSSTAPPAGRMTTPTFTPNVFLPETTGTTVAMSQITTNVTPAGIYTIWLEGRSGDPYFQARSYPVAVRVGGAVRDFSLVNSTTSGSAASAGAIISLPIHASTAAAGATRWGGGGPVQLSVDTASLPAGMTPGHLALSSTTVTPTSSGGGALSTLTIDTTGLAAGAYRFDLRATGTNGDGQPVTHVQPISFTVATATEAGSYVDIIGFAVVRVATVTANSIDVQAISGSYADPDHPDLRRVQTARLVPWE